MLPQLSQTSQPNENDVFLQPDWFQNKIQAFYWFDWFVIAV